MAGVGRHGSGPRAQGSWGETSIATGNLGVSAGSWGWRWLLISPGSSEEVRGKKEQETEMHYVDTEGQGVWQVAICFEGPEEAKVCTEEEAQEMTIDHKASSQMFSQVPLWKTSITSALVALSEDAYIFSSFFFMISLMI